jgi:hypothetical protein
MNNSPFYIGQEVVCIDASEGFYMGGFGLVEGNIYTVKDLFNYGYAWAVNVGTMVDGVHEDAWICDRFAPIERTRIQYVIKEVEVAPAIIELEKCLS